MGPNWFVSLTERAAAEEQLGQWGAALKYYEQAFRFSIERRDELCLLEVTIRIAHCHRRAGEEEAGEEHFELALAMAKSQGDLARAGRSLNGLGILRQNRGDVEGAESIYLEARELAIQAGDNSVIGHIEQNLGSLANIRGDHAVAMKHYGAGLQHLEKAGDEKACAGVLNNLGMLHVDLRLLDQAEHFFDQALATCKRTGDVVTAIILHLNRTEMFLVRGEPNKARTSCDEAYEIASKLNDLVCKAEALKFYGVIYRETGKLHLAESHLQQAVSLTEGVDPLLEAEAHRELALVLRALNRNREALTSLNRSHILFKRLQAQHDQADVTSRISNLEGDFLSLVRNWGESIEAKDRYTGGHCQRVADYACRIAEEAGIPEHDITWFRMGAFLHDVGKMEVPAEILNKPGRLTDEERLIMERHTVIGDEMLAPVEFPWDIRPIVRSHHERWDGTGYPDRLVGEAIPFTARILRIADIFDALTTARSYRKPLSPEQAYAIMEDDYGSFDPELFEIFRRLYPEFADRARQAHSDADEEPVRPTPSEVVA
jgi:putative nucleotidyltransferase with HDIG domain